MHIALADAKAYAKWKGHELPSEAEWEYAAKAGSDSRYAWGDEAYPDDIFMANTWQGRFPMMGTGKMDLNLLHLWVVFRKTIMDFLI